MGEETTEELTFDEIGGEHIDPESTPTEEESSEEKKEEPSSEEDEKKEEPSPEEDEKKEDEVDPENVVRLKAGEKFHEIPADATARVRVNGKNELVPLSELTANYSGKVAYDEKFSQLEGEKAELKKSEEGLRAEVEQIGQLLNSENPLDAALYLAKLAGHDPVDFRSNIMNHLSEEISSLLEMGESERELHLLKAGKSINERLDQVALKAKEKQTSPDANVDQLVRVAGISKEQYEQSLQFLKEEKLDSTPEAVIGHAKLAPFIDKAIEHLSPYEESLGEDDLNKMTGLLAEEYQRTGSGDHEAAIKKVAAQMGYEIAAENKKEESPPADEKKVDSKKEQPKGEDLMFDDNF